MAPIQFPAFDNALHHQHCGENVMKVSNEEQFHFILSQEPWPEVRADGGSSLQRGELGVERHETQHPHTQLLWGTVELHCAEGIYNGRTKGAITLCLPTGTVSLSSKLSRFTRNQTQHNSHASN